MDKLIRVPKSNRAEEPLLDIEERRHNYDDRRSYTSYDEITKDFEDDFRCQDDNEEANNSISALSTTCIQHDGLERENSPSVEKEGLLIGNGKENSCCRQRKLPILPSQHLGSISHANATSLPFPSSPSTFRDTRSATKPAAFGTVSASAGVGGDEGTEAVRTDNIRVKSSKTLQESIRESLTINNTTQDKLGSGGGTNRLIFEMNEFYIDMLERLNEMKKNFAHKKTVRNSIETDPKIKVEFEEWFLADNLLIDQIVNKPETTDICKYDPKIIKEFENIVRLDKEIEMADLLCKKIKEERLEIQRNCCQQAEEHSGVNFEKSQMFLELCASEITSEEKPLAENNDINVTMKKSKCKSGKNFIKRNMDLAKNMISLTDEEKIKLDAILAEENDSREKDEKLEEIDESAEEDDLNESIKSKNEYKLLNEDWERMSEINDKIKNISTVEEILLDINDVECQLEDDMKLGKNWKYSLLNERLKEIDDQLVKITIAREEESASNELITDINQSDGSLELIEIPV